MSVFLRVPYQGYAASSTTAVTFPPSTEAALIAQGLAYAGPVTGGDNILGGPDYYATQAGAVALASQGGNGTPTYAQGPAFVCNMSFGNTAMTVMGTSSVHVAGTMNISELNVRHWNTWKGLAMLNGTTAATDNFLVALYGADGTLLANSAVAGTVASGASTFQSRDFLFPVTLPPGRYFAGVQCNGTTAHSNKFVSANGPLLLTGSSTGTFGTVPATITTPTTFTTAVGVVCALYQY